MSLFTARCIQVRKAQLAFYAAADAAQAASAVVDAAGEAQDPVCAAAAAAAYTTAQDAFAAALHHFQTIRRGAQADFPNLTMSEVHFAAGF